MEKQNDAVLQKIQRTNIKLLALANGDEYVDCAFNGSITNLKNKILNRDFIEIREKKKKIVLNSEFIISFEIDEGNKTSFI